jgi:uncharacterized membrane protein YcaP (DUF421 family)
MFTVLLPTKGADDTLSQGIASGFLNGIFRGTFDALILYFGYLKLWGKRIETAASMFTVLLGMMVGGTLADLYRGYSYAYVIPLYVIATVVVCMGYRYIYNLHNKANKKP